MSWSDMVLWQGFKSKQRSMKVLTEQLYLVHTASFNDGPRVVSEPQKVRTDLYLCFLQKYFINRISDMNALWQMKVTNLTSQSWSAAGVSLASLQNMTDTYDEITGRLEARNNWIPLLSLYFPPLSVSQPLTRPFLFDSALLSNLLAFLSLSAVSSHRLLYFLSLYKSSLFHWAFWTHPTLLFSRALPPSFTVSFWNNSHPSRAAGLHTVEYLRYADYTILPSPVWKQKAACR